MNSAKLSALVLAGMLSLGACPVPRDEHPERTPSPTACNLGAGQCPMQSGRQDAPKSMAS